ncbi:hypothetical protein DCO58_11540 [Helicobacter saguini]|uniref:TonB-dependent receptor-like beta-barrel domain-containing protein n=1 Tax=Helicobacter saguini TaxID=1548018 RepID=A0A6B0HQQ5_9HELI|nr:hypothetical protein [Helicobacter saguini]MWV61078.1 hypothetical protein [Helicobacter saguini]MWV68253.1 hypothetical protein [Helicobacter saguini]MWV70283.1 hypothetical protein [Helicobacter saguini]MWV72185.1 hypothetical protein [Helicobacter saguini]
MASVYVNLDSMWLESLSTTLGLRYDFWQNFDGYFRNATLDSKNQSNNLSIFPLNLA